MVTSSSREKESAFRSACVVSLEAANRVIERFGKESDFHLSSHWISFLESAWALFDIAGFTLYEDDIDELKSRYNKLSPALEDYEHACSWLAALKASDPTEEGKRDDEAFLKGVNPRVIEQFNSARLAAHASREAYASWHHEELKEAQREVVTGGRWFLNLMREYARFLEFFPVFETTNSTQNMVDADQQDVEPQPPGLSRSERVTLVTLNSFDRSVLLSVAKIHAALDPTERSSEETIRKDVLKLIELDLAERPEGERKGARLTNTGRRLAGKIAD